MGQPFIIDNHAAAGGVFARNLAAQAFPDGYTCWYSPAAGLSVRLSFKLNRLTCAPGAVISHLNREIGATLALPDIQNAMKSSGTDPWHLSPAEFTRMVEETERKWRKLSQSAKLVLE